MKKSYFAGRRYGTLSCWLVTVLVGMAVALARPADAQRPALDDDLPLIDAPWSNDATKFSFVILGDKTSGGEGKWPIFDRAVDSINLLAPDFVITVGDQIPGHMQDRAAWDAEWAEYMGHAERIEAPLFLIVGNHDIANVECYRFWQEDFGKTYYSFDYKGCHFLVLNTEEERFDGRGPHWEAMMAWMEADLRSAEHARHTFVFFHKPMWDDPRFYQDWERVDRALGSRPFTAVAGHEHYLATERREGNLYVIQNATGGGIRESDVKAFGGFHGFGFVTVDGDEVTYAVVEPDGGIWPVDVAPLSFRKSINCDIARLDTVSHTRGDGEIALETVAVFQNVFDDVVTVRLRIAPVGTATWEPHDVEHWRRDEDAVVTEVTLAPGDSLERPLAFRVAEQAAGYPPALQCDVRYDGAWLEKESMPMEEMAVVPLYPRAVFRPVPEWHVVGPFAIGPIDTSQLPDRPDLANAGFVTRFGPENGIDLSMRYDGNRTWKRVQAHENGLINTNALLGTDDEAVAYAACGIFSPTAQDTHVALYADNFAQIVLNGTLIESVQDMGWRGGYVFVPVSLREGWNALTVKIINNKADWFARVLVADPQGLLRFAPAPE